MSSLIGVVAIIKLFITTIVDSAHNSRKSNYLYSVLQFNNVIRQTERKCEPYAAIRGRTTDHIQKTPNGRRMIWNNLE